MYSSCKYTGDCSSAVTAGKGARSYRKLTVGAEGNSYFSHSTRARTLLSGGGEAVWACINCAV